MKENALIEDNYCSFKTSKLLKAAGYPQNIGLNLHWYSFDGVDKTEDIVFKSQPIVAGDIVGPTLSCAMKWLRTMKDLYVEVRGFRSDFWSWNVYEDQHPSIYLANKAYVLVVKHDERVEFSTPEEAAEVGINEALRYMKSKEYKLKHK